MLRLPPTPGFAKPRCTKSVKADPASNAASRVGHRLGPIHRASVDRNCFNCAAPTCVFETRYRSFRIHSPRSCAARGSWPSVLQVSLAAIVCRNAHTHACKVIRGRISAQGRPQPTQRHLPVPSDATKHTVVHCNTTNPATHACERREAQDWKSASPARKSSVLGLREPSDTVRARS